MRKIVSCINSPFAKISKWIVAELKQYGQFDGFSVKNSYEFVDKVKDIEIEADEILVSFDVTALFPSVPVTLAIGAIREHLENNNNLTPNKINSFIFAIEMCMKHNCFQFRNQFYSNNNGCSMGNSLSPLVAEAFMCKFERDLKTDGILPRIWYRYVDDTFAVVKSSEFDTVFEAINSRYDSIKFTYEKEEETSHTIAFLDLNIRRIGREIGFSVHRKLTTTDRYITHDSFCSHQHKIAAFNSMVYRMIRLPLSVADYKNEYDHIVHLARVNGFDVTLVDRIVKKHADKVRRENMSTLFTQNKTHTQTNERRIAMSYVPKITNKLNKCFKRAGLSIIHTHNKNGR